jgi:hypothetical protein
MVVDNVAERVERGESVEARIVHWLNADGHAADTSVQRLRGIAWLPDSTGRPTIPNRLFRRDHELSPYFAMLAESLRQDAALLDVLDVPLVPSPRDVSILLLVFGERAQREPEPYMPPRWAVRACWRVVLADPEFDVSGLHGQPVLLAGGERLYRPDEVVVDDVPIVSDSFSADARERFVRSIDSEAALRIGARKLSEVGRSRIVAQGPAADGRRVGDAIGARQQQLARIVIGEHGRWEDVLDLTSEVVVRAYEWVTVEWHLDGFPEIPATHPETVGAHFTGAGELIVAIAAHGPDWFEVAQRLRERLCPESSPSVTVAIEEALRVESDEVANERLTRLGYGRLDDDHWQELNRRLQHLARRDDAIAADQPTADQNESLHSDVGVQGLDEHADETDRRPAEEPESPPGTAHPTPPSRSTDRGPATPTRGESGDDARPADKDDGESPRRSIRAQPTVSQLAGVASRSSAKPTNPGAGAGNASTVDSRPAYDRELHEPPSRSEQRTGLGTARRREHERWYVIASGQSGPDRDRSETGRHEARRRAAIDAAGMVAVGAHEEHAGRNPVVPDDPNHPGFDLWSCDDDGDVLRWIEVKSLAGAWGQNGFPKLTPRQWRQAAETRDGFWLYVVEHAESDAPVITRIQDPWGKVTRYVLDPGWKAAREQDTVPRRTARDAA